MEVKNMFDIYAPIIPYEGLGGIKLYSTLDELRPLLDAYHAKAVSYLPYKDWTRYEIKDTAYLFFHNKNRKLWQICALEKYKGKLFDKISVDMTEQELLQVDNSFVFSELSESFSSPKGVFIETETHTTGEIYGIAIYIKERDNPDFEEAKW